MLCGPDRWMWVPKVKKKSSGQMGKWLCKKKERKKENARGKTGERRIYNFIGKVHRACNIAPKSNC